MTDVQTVLEYLDNEDPKLVSFALSYADRMARDNADFAFENLSRFGGRSLAQARLLQVVVDLRAAWEKAEQLGVDVDQAYWDEFSIYGRGSFKLVDDASRGLIKHGRPAAALDLMSIYLHSNGDDTLPDPSLVVEGLTVIGTGDEELGRLSGYEIQELLAYLRRCELDDDELATLEWRLFPALGYEPEGLALHRKLANDPSFFVEILSLGFRVKGDKEASEVPQHVAANAYHLLSTWHTIPGSQGPGEAVDSALLDFWYHAATPILTEAGRLDIGEEYLGRTLAYGPREKDGTWPDSVVRMFIEKSSSTHLEAGFRIECFNMRGVVTRSLDEGGKQEYALAEEYANWANQIAISAPRTAAVLRSLSNGYRLDGQREDDEAQRFREGFDS